MDHFDYCDEVSYPDYLNLCCEHCNQEVNIEIQNDENDFNDSQIDEVFHYLHKRLIVNNNSLSVCQDCFNNSNLNQETGFYLEKLNEDENGNYYPFEIHYYHSVMVSDENFSREVTVELTDPVKKYATV